MDVKKQIFTLAFSLFFCANYYCFTKERVYIIYNSFSCYNCNLQLKQYFDTSSFSKRKVRVTTVTQNPKMIRSAKKVYNGYKVKYLQKIIDSIPESSLNHYNMHFPSVLIEKNGNFYFIPFRSLFIGTNINSELLNKSIRY